MTELRAQDPPGSQLLYRILPRKTYVVASSAPAGQGPGDEARQLVAAAMGGDSSALGKLADLAAAMRRMHTNEAVQVRSALWSAFDLLGTEAGKGNTAALNSAPSGNRQRNTQTAPR